MLSDKGISKSISDGQIYISPYVEKCLQPNSYDLYIDNDIRDVAGDIVETGLYIQPHSFVLGTSVEYIKLSSDMSALLHTRSSIGRLGISMHATAGLIDAGFEGRITYEITNFTDRVIKINSGEPVAQLTFHPLDQPAQKPYDGEYNGQIKPTRSKLLRN